MIREGCGRKRLKSFYSGFVKELVHHYFKRVGIFVVLNTTKKRKLANFVDIHLQLCADNGDELLKTLMANKEINKLFVADCNQRMQQKCAKMHLRKQVLIPVIIFAYETRERYML